MGRKPYKLTESDVNKIRKSDLSQNQLARAFGVSLVTIYDIIHNNRRVKHGMLCGCGECTEV